MQSRVRRRVHARLQRDLVRDRDALLAQAPHPWQVTLWGAVTILERDLHRHLATQAIAARPETPEDNARRRAVTQMRVVFPELAVAQSFVPDPPTRPAGRPAEPFARFAAIVRHVKQQYGVPWIDIAQYVLEEVAPKLPTELQRTLNPKHPSVTVAEIDRFLERVKKARPRTKSAH